jgi:hypothetical protein
MEVVWWLHIQSGLPEDEADALKYVEVLTIFFVRLTVHLELYE